MLQVRDIMTREVVTLSPEMTLREASDVLAGKHVSGAPVVAGGRVVGVVSQSDILAFVTTAPPERDEPTGVEMRAPEEESAWAPLPEWEELPETPPSYFSQPWTELAEEAEAAQLIETEPLADARGYELGTLDAHTVEEVMSRALHALRPVADVAEAADYMRSAGIHRVLVMEDGELRGIVTTLDVARAVADHRVRTRVYVFGRRAEERGERADV
jgi:CBS domain-containing protein